MFETKKKKESYGTFAIEKICQANNLLEVLRKVVESHPNKDAQNLGMSIVYLLAEKDEKSLECLYSLAALYPEIPIIQRRIAEMMINSTKYPNAVSLLENVIKLDKKDFTAMFWLALCYYETGQSEKGSKTFEQLRESVFLLHVSDSTWLT